MANVDPEPVMAAFAAGTVLLDDVDGESGAGCANKTAPRNNNAKRTEQETESFTEGSPYRLADLRFAQDVALRAGGTIAPSESLDLA